MRFREALAWAEEHGQVIRIDAPVDPYVELPGVVNTLERSSPNRETPALLFENIKGVPGGRVLCNLFASPDRLMTFLNLPPRGSAAHKEQFLRALSHPIAPEVLASGPCKQNIKRDGIDVARLFPAITTTPQEPAPYYQPLVVSRNPETGGMNVGEYRVMIKGPDELVLNIRREQHIGAQFELAKARQEPFPVAIVMGAEPAAYVAASTKLPYGYSEWDFTGALLGRPLELVRAETSDLLVPAHAEIVLEGHIYPPYATTTEGPKEEYMGYPGAPQPNPIFKVECVTYRDQPIEYSLLAAGSDTYNLLLGAETRVYQILKEFAPGFFLDAAVVAATAWHWVVIQVKKQTYLQEGLQINAALAAFAALTYLDTVIVVDEDVNIYDINDVIWAICTRCNPTGGVHVLPEGRTHRDVPIGAVRERTHGVVRGKMIIDATVPIAYKDLMKTEGLPYFQRSRFQQADLKQYLSPEWLKKLNLA